MVHDTLDILVPSNVKLHMVILLGHSHDKFSIGYLNRGAETKTTGHALAIVLTKQKDHARCE